MTDNREALVLDLRADNELKPEVQAAIGQLEKFGVTAEESAAMVDKALARAQAKFGSFAAAAGQAAEQVEGQWKSSLKSVNQLADQIVSAGANAGKIDLGVEQAQQAVLVARQRLAVLQQLEAAEIRNAGAEQASNVAVQQHIAAIRTAIAEEQARVQGLALEAGALERLQIELRNGATAEELFGASLRQSTATSGAARAGLQNLGFQLQDVAVQFASGQRASVIFAQQLPQVAMAITQISAASNATSGALASFARFMSGPWGIAVGIGAAVLPPLIGMLFQTGNAAMDAANKIYTFKDAIAQLRTAPMQAIGNLQSKVFIAQGKLNAARNMQIPQGTGEASRAAQVQAQQNRDRAIREAEADYQAAQSELAVAKATAKSNEQLFQIVGSAGKLRAKNLPPDDDGGAVSTRRRAAGRSAGKSYREGAEVELDKLKKISDEIFDSFKAKAEPQIQRATKDFEARNARGAQFIRDGLQASLNERTQPLLDQANSKAGPLRDYTENLKQAVGGTDELNRALQAVEVDGLQSLEDGLASVITGTQSVASAFKNMANAIIADLVRIAVKKLILSVFGFSDGGLIGKAAGKATGGLITGPGSGTSDDVPIWASNGEFMMRAEAVRRIGVENLEALNSGRMPGFAAGGLIGGTINAPRMPAMRTMSGGRGQVVHQHIWQVNARGAILAEGLVAEMQQVGVRAAVGGAELARVQGGERQMSSLY